jgi:hypothetical protein
LIANREYRVGFYDYQGIFFELFDSKRPDQSYSYACADGEDYFVIRVSHANGYREHRVTQKTARYLMNLR